MTPPLTNAAPSIPRAIGWAAYLACSWTWCIGMFLPALLFRDFGIWSFAAFAIPNVVGAAAMGWIIREPAIARAVSHNHRAAITAFSLVTIAFQAFFLATIATHSSPTALAVASAAACAGALLAFGRVKLIGAALLLLLSIGLVTFAALAFNWSPSHRIYSFTPHLDPLHTIPLSLVCILGFALCPYLDSTFIEARAAAESPRDSRIAFTLGFGLFFLTMIVGTLVYLPMLGPTAQPSWLFQSSKALSGALLLIHIAAQLGFTIARHSAATFRPAPTFHNNQPPTGNSNTLFKIAIPAAIVLGVAIGYFTSDIPASDARLSTFEFTYRLFMSFYGLIFPAYILICMVPINACAAVAPSLARLIICACTIITASPAYYLGSIQKQTWWLAVGVGVVLIGALIARFADPRPRTTLTPTAPLNPPA